MSTWFSNLKDLSKDLTAKVQAAIPKIDNETLQKLTLSTPELKAEREALQQEYFHKVAVKDSLAHMYPWETRDDERDILVEECKEAILGLSDSIETFFGPYQMPLLNVNTDEDEEEDDTDTKELVDDEVTEEDAEIVTKKIVKDMNPSPETLEKLSKLEPLPPLLSNFDLLAHVGLIQKMLKVDKKLVERQSTLSGKSFLSFVALPLTSRLQHIECWNAFAWFLISLFFFRWRRARKDILEKLFLSLCIYTV
jgi:hypothetical protein